jgi:hypothetical protein
MLVAGCSGSNDSPESFCGEPLQEVSQGIYGQVTAPGDGGVEVPQQAEIEVFDTPAARNIIDEVASDAAGIYQLGLPAGTFALCAAFGCVEPVLEPGTHLRADLVDQQWTLSPRPGCVH